MKYVLLFYDYVSDLSALGLWNCVKFTYSQRATKFYLTLFGKFEKKYGDFYACCCLLAD